MRLRSAHRIGVLAIYLLAHLGLGACSSTQQQQGEEEVEASEGEEGNVVDEGGEEMNENSAEEATGEEGNVATNDAAEDGNMAADEAPVQNNQTGSDLQEIISEMDNTGGEQAVPPAQGEAVAEAAPAEAMPADAAPMDAAAAPVAADESQAAPVASAPAGSGLPEMNSKMPYIVQPGDTLGTIAKKIYGDIAMWKDIKTLTNLRNPSRIYPGDVVYYRLTEQSMAFASNYENQPKAELVVGQGDTLASIASRLGSANAWRTIWRLNDGVDNPDNLTVGSTIYHYQTVQGAAVQDNSGSETAELNNTIDNQLIASVAVDATQDNGSVTAGFLALASLISANFAG